MKSKSGSTNVLSCGLALPVLTAMGSPCASRHDHDLDPFASLSAPDAIAAAFGPGESAIDIAFIELEATALFDDGTDGCQQRFESAQLHPPCEAAMNGAFAAKLRRKVLPSRPIIQDPEYAGNRLALVGRRPAAFETNRMNR